MSILSKFWCHASCNMETPPPSPRGICARVMMSDANFWCGTKCSASANVFANVCRPRLGTASWCKRCSLIRLHSLIHDSAGAGSASALCQRNNTSQCGSFLFFFSFTARSWSKDHALNTSPCCTLHWSIPLPFDSPPSPWSPLFILFSAFIWMQEQMGDLTRNPAPTTTTTGFILARSLEQTSIHHCTPRYGFLPLHPSSIPHLTILGIIH